MWCPVELHASRGQVRDLSRALAAQLRTSRHYALVTKRRIDGRAIDNSLEAATQMVCLLEDCAVAYIGARHGTPIAPYAGFTLARELGIAYLEHLIDYDPPSENQQPRRWLTNGLHAFVFLLFREHTQIDTVVLPLLGEPGVFDGYVVEQDQDLWVATRNRRSSAAPKATPT